MGHDIVLVNTNISRPPVSPVGLEYVAEALVTAGVSVRAVDLAFADDWRECLRNGLKDEPLAVGVSVRNTDDCCFASRQSFLPWIREVVVEVKRVTGAPVTLGGVGFSVSPEVTLKFAGADYGIAGDGEPAMLQLVQKLRKGEDIRQLPNLVFLSGGQVVCNPRADADLTQFPLPRRRTFDNKRYEQYGAMVGIETKRGCAQPCTFCADPVAKGKKVRLRPPETVALEFQDLIEQGVSYFHLSDSEFNLPPGHAKDVCRAIIARRLGDRIKWYCYASPIDFDDELARLMKQAGCAGINFGVDSLCDAQLKRLGKRHTVDDVRQLARIMRRNGINYIVDLLIGAPGETSDTLRTTIDIARKIPLPLVGMAAGVRVYPGTMLAKAVAQGGIKDVLYPGGERLPEQPLFYMSPALGGDAIAAVNRLAGDDPRFFVLSTPEEKGNYNYAGDELLSRLIQQGARGAYWDILRQHRGTCKII